MQRRAERLARRYKESNYCNDSDREIVEALERIFIYDQEPLNDWEEQELQRHSKGILRVMLVAIVTFTAARIMFSFVGHDEITADFHSFATSAFFGILFLEIHIETKNPSRILLLLTYVSLCISLWT